MAKTRLRGGEIDFTSGWEELQSHTAKMHKGRGGIFGHFAIYHTGPHLLCQHSCLPCWVLCFLLERLTCKNCIVGVPLPSDFWLGWREGLTRLWRGGTNRTLEGEGRVSPVFIMGSLALPFDWRLLLLGRHSSVDSSLLWVPGATLFLVPLLLQAPSYCLAPVAFQHHTCIFINSPCMKPSLNSLGYAVPCWDPDWLALVSFDPTIDRIRL